MFSNILTWVPGRYPWAFWRVLQRIGGVSGGPSCFQQWLFMCTRISCMFLSSTRDSEHHRCRGHQTTLVQGVGATLTDTVNIANRQESLLAAVNVWTLEVDTSHSWNTSAYAPGSSCFSLRSSDVQAPNINTVVALYVYVYMYVYNYIFGNIGSIICFS